MKTFDIINSPLVGTNLIEASAGTGKTYTIEALYVRLILEKKLLVDQILVVTFTNAATEELKDRIRKKLLGARDAFSGGKKQDPFIDVLVQQHDNPEIALQLIHDALINFDKAAIRLLCTHGLHQGSQGIGHCRIPGDRLCPAKSNICHQDLQRTGVSQDLGLQL